MSCNANKMNSGISLPVAIVAPNATAPMMNDVRFFFFSFASSSGVLFASSGESFSTSTSSSRVFIHARIIARGSNVAGAT